jgi:hypothetical protein
LGVVGVDMDRERVERSNSGQEMEQNLFSSSQVYQSQSQCYTVETKKRKERGAI